jgi:ribosome maturation factor RimP
MEEAGMYPDGNFSLEISSPGVDEPLKNIRQFKKNTGRDVMVTFPDEKTLSGKLLQADDECFLISHTEGKGKKAVTEEKNLHYTDVKQVQVLVKF